MKFSNKVSLEKREVLQELYKEFIQNNSITKEEKKLKNTIFYLSKIKATKIK